MVSVWQLDATLGLFLLASFAHDRFRWLNRQADRIEDRWFPSWLHYNALGDFASWIQHGITCALVAGAWGLLCLVLGIGFGVGFLHGAALMMAFYAVREGHQAYSHAREGGLLGPFVDRRGRAPYQHGPHVGWLIDGLMDVVLPALNLWAAWRI